jgi:hypothetical protein
VLRAAYGRPWVGPGNTNRALAESNNTLESFFRTMLHTPMAIRRRDNPPV